MSRLRWRCAAQGRWWSARLATGLAALAMLAAGAAGAQEGPGGRTFRVLMILEGAEGPVEEGFRGFLAEQGVRAEFTVRSIDGDRQRLPELVDEAKRLRPDLVYTYGADVTLGVVGRYDRVDPRRHVTDLPVVYTMVSSPEGTRIVPSRRSSRRNVTGVDHTVPVASQIRAMRAYRPVTRLAVIYNPEEENSAHNVKQLRELAAETGFELLAEPVPLGADGLPDAAALPDLVTSLARREPQFLYLGADNFVAAHADAITAAATANLLPTFAVSEAAVSRSGALVGLVNRDRNVGRFTALKALQILVEGKRPAQIPNNTLGRFTLLVNMGAAERLGLYPPMAVLSYAEVVRD